MQGKYDQLYRSLFEIVSFFVSPKQDKLLLQSAGVSLDTALFPLLMQIAYRGAVGIGELASQVGRDHSTVSRQVDKLLVHDLVTQTDESSDKRVRQVALTDAGKAISDRIAATRRAKMRQALHGWNEKQLVELLDSLHHLAETTRNFDNFIERRTNRSIGA